MHTKAQCGIMKMSQTKKTKQTPGKHCFLRIPFLSGKVHIGKLKLPELFVNGNGFMFAGVTFNNH